MKKFAIAMVLCLSAANGFLPVQDGPRVSAHKEMSDGIGRHRRNGDRSTAGTGSVGFSGWRELYRCGSTRRSTAKVHENTEVTVFSENSPRFFAMYVGQQYVLYLQPQYGRNQVDNCGNSHSTEEILSAKQPRLKRCHASRVSNL